MPRGPLIKTPRPQSRLTVAVSRANASRVHHAPHAGGLDSLPRLGVGLGLRHHSTEGARPLVTESSTATQSTPTYAPGTPMWVDHTSKDVAASARFYGELFGWQS